MFRWVEIINEKMRWIDRLMDGWNNFNYFISNFFDHINLKLQFYPFRLILELIFPLNAYLYD